MKVNSRKKNQEIPRESIYNYKHEVLDRYQDRLDSVILTLYRGKTSIISVSVIFTCLHYN